MVFHLCSCLKSLTRHGLASRHTVKGGSARAALLSLLALLGGSEWARDVSTGRWRGQVVGSDGWATVLGRRSTRLDGHLRKACTRNNALFAAVHCGAECLKSSQHANMSVCW